MESLVVVGMPFSGTPQIAEVLRSAGAPVREADEVPIVRCTPHGAAAAITASLQSVTDADRVVFPYRNPWDCTLDSLKSRKSRLVSDPGIARGAWLAYYRAVLDYVAEHPGSSAVVFADAVLDEPGCLATIFPSGTPVLRAPERDAAAWRGDDDPIRDLYGLLYPELVGMRRTLDSIASVPSPSGAPGAEVLPDLLRPGGSLPAGTGVQVIIPCRDDGRFISEAIASVARSAPGPVELTIVDDGSTDPETLRVMELLAGADYQVVRTDGVGLAQARNIAVALSSTAAVLPLDSDNMVRAAMFDGLEPILTDTADVVYGSLQGFGMSELVGTPPLLTWDNVLPYNIVDPCAMTSRRIIERVGGWDPSFRAWEDWDFWMSAMENGARFQVLPQVCFDYCQRPGSLLRTAIVDDDVRSSIFRDIYAKHRASLEPVIAEGFIELERRRVALEHKLKRAWAEVSLLREQARRRGGIDSSTSTE